jgi:hypothetical protein
MAVDIASDCTASQGVGAAGAGGPASTVVGGGGGGWSIATPPSGGMGVSANFALPLQPTIAPAISAPTPIEPKIFLEFIMLVLVSGVPCSAGLRTPALRVRANDLRWKRRA